MQESYKKFHTVHDIFAKERDTLIGQSIRQLIQKEENISHNFFGKK